VILHTVASVLLFAFATSSLAAEVPGDLLGTWSTDSVCNLNASPNEVFIYTFGPKYISYYEIECLIQDVKPGLDKVDFNLDCFKGGGFRYFDKLRIQRPSSDKLSLTFKFPSQGDSQLVYRCSHEVPEVERRTGEKITRWMHNNSLVTLNEADHTLEIDYETPRPGMMAVGVRQGTMLFFGTRTGAEIEGIAYISTTTVGRSDTKCGEKCWMPKICYCSRACRQR
jgi:hypothetical protein